MENLRNRFLISSHKRTCHTLFVMTFLAALGFAATQSFDPTTGKLAVDMASFMAKQQVVFNGLVTDSSRAITVGNGRVGAMVWNARGLTLQVSGVDASPQAALSAGRLQLNTVPAIDASPGTIQQTLSLYDGALYIQYATGRRVTVFGVPNSEILGIHVQDDRTNVQSVNFDVGIWDPATSMSTRGGTAFVNSLQGEVASVAAWKAISTLVETSVGGVNRAQTDAWGFGYTLAATVEGAAFKTSLLDSRTVRFAITPAKSYTIYVACASRTNATGGNSVDAAKNALAAIAAKGFATNIAVSRSWWHDFWAKSFVQLSNGGADADYVENYWYLSTYLISTGCYGKYPMHFINGVYRSNMDNDIHWSPAYWWWNTRDVYSGLYAANHVDAADGLANFYSGLLSKIKATTKSRYNIDGAWVAETIRWDGDPKYTTGSDYTGDIMSTGAEVALFLFDRFRYTNDSAFLRTKAYPFLRDATNFLAAKLTYNASTGVYTMASSNAHEMWWDVPNALTDLAAVRALFPRAIAVSTALGLDANLRTRWQDVLAKLVPVKTETVNGAERYRPYDLPNVSSHNNENIVTEPAWPYGTTGIGAPDFAVAVNSFNTRSNPYANIWSPCPIQAARLGLGDSAFGGMKAMLSKYQDYTNGLTSNSNGVFEMVGVPQVAMVEAMLQSYKDTIRVFPAVPTQSTVTARFTLLATGGFLVSSEKEAGNIKYVGFKSQYGGRANVFNPWGSEAIQVKSLPSGAAIATGSGSNISFPTTAGGVYILERVAKPFSAFTASTVTATANGSAKKLTSNGRTVSIGSGTGVPQIVGIRDQASLDRMVAFRWSAGRLTVSGVETGNVQIFDALGHIRTFDLVHGSVQMGKLPGGVYHVRIRADAGNATGHFLVTSADP